MFSVGLSFTAVVLLIGRKAGHKKTTKTKKGTEGPVAAEEIGADAAVAAVLSERKTKSSTEGFPQGKRCFFFASEEEEEYALLVICQWCTAKFALCVTHRLLRSSVHPLCCAPGASSRSLSPAFGQEHRLDNDTCFFSLITVGETRALNPELLNPGLLAVRQQR